MYQAGVEAVRRLLSSAVGSQSEAGLDVAEIEKSLEYLAADVEIVQPRSLPYGGNYFGREGMCDEVDAVTRLFQICIHDLEYHDADDVVVVEGVMTATARATGRSAEVPFVELFWIRDGRIVRMRPYPDTKALLDLLD